MPKAVIYDWRSLSIISRMEDGTELIKRLRSIHPNLLAIMISPYDFQTVAEQLKSLNVPLVLEEAL